ncbi:exodeoxyribonuclease III [uncultured Duncaniella sp.]|uniref:exodeoxyribonuclease III n=1 Tax=uncultured Duncaniella sp. TaxID=2768039 RepID=UPI0025A9BC83|nr:exodeoxyribonuclease III [uncultured Duncaniella sp.]
MRIVSWNVAGLRACIRKGFWGIMRDLNPDIICLQEVKATATQVDIELDGYTAVWNPAEKAGYSGTLILSRVPIQDQLLGIGIQEHQLEGRVITVDCGPYYLVTSYTPNSKKDLIRLDYRLQWEEDFQRFLHLLDQRKPVILCGDLNVAHEEIDLAHPNTNHNSPGFSDEERQAMSQLLSSGFTDTFRKMHPSDETYSFWTYFGNARANNTGWRLDYFIVSNRLMSSITRSDILTDIQGSDHCPILLELGY